MPTALNHQPRGFKPKALHGFGGDWPVSAVNTRLNWRGLKLAASASSSTLSA
jgi:hypothetical protein